MSNDHAAQESRSPDYVERARSRSERITANRARSFADAEAWDLDFWQSRTAADRLTAFVHLRRDVALAQAARAAANARGS